MNIDSLVRKTVSNMKEYTTPPILETPVKLNQNESPYELPAFIKREITKRIQTIELNRYFDGSCKTLREKIAKKYSVKSDQVIVGAGIDELFYYLMLAFVENKDKVVRAVPSFSMYQICSQIADANDVAIPLNENFELTEEFVKETKDAKITFICRPNNPTGNSFNKELIKQIATTTKGIVCIDEAYAEFAQEDCLDLLEFPNVIIMRTFSKIYSSAALRIGYGIANAKIIEYMNRVRLPWNISIISQIAAEVIIDNDNVFAKRKEMILKERERFISKLKTIAPVLPTDANFLLFKVANPKRIFEELIKKGVLIRNVSSYPSLQDYLRVNVGTKKENDIFIAALSSVLTKLSLVEAIIFDIDGVLVDVSGSYREAIKLTVEEEIGRRPNDEEIQAIKKQPYSNNDWVVTYALATDFKGDLSKIDKNDNLFLKLKEKFQKYYIGGLIDQEPILIEKTILKKLLDSGLKIGFVTSRPRAEAIYALNRIENFNKNFVIAQEDCDEEKPSPKPIKTLLERMNTQNAVYIGDTINDQLAAQRAEIEYQAVDQKQDVNDIIKRLLI